MSSQAQITIFTLCITSFQHSAQVFISTPLYLQICTNTLNPESCSPTRHYLHLPEPRLSASAAPAITRLSTVNTSNSAIRQEKREKSIRRINEWQLYLWSCCPETHRHGWNQSSLFIGCRGACTITGLFYFYFGTRLKTIHTGGNLKKALMSELFAE